MVSKIKLRLAISAGEKSRVPLGTDGLMDAIAANVQSIMVLTMMNDREGGYLFYVIIKPAKTRSIKKAVHLIL